MTAPPDVGDGFAALLPSGSADHERLAEGLILALPEPALLVTSRGAILVANGAAAALFQATPATLRGRRLTDFVSDEPEAVARYVGACARTRSPLPGVLHPLARRNPGRLSDQMGRGDERAAIGSAASADATMASTEAGPSRHGVLGAAVRPAAPRALALILLRFRAREEASNRFALLNRQLEESRREIRARRRADAALQSANARLEEQTRALESMNRRLRDQAAELERQIGAARDLAEELVGANDALRHANEDLREQSRAAEAARREAESANRAKSDFLAVMSHELRTPLNAIGGYVELIELGIRGPVTEAQRADLGRIQRAQRHLLARISEVLSFARLEAGQVHYDYGDVIVDALLRDIESLVAPQMKAQRLRYVYEGVMEAIVARADREKLEQILLNLLSNAVKFTPSGGTITVSCAAEERWVRIRVRDTGVGIAPDKIERVFEPFVQLDQRLSRSRDGVGLGLAISRDLARAMGGDLSVASTPGAGSTFTLALPAVG